MGTNNEGGVIVNLNAKIAGMNIKNPLMPASGPLVGDYEKMMAIASFGVGAMVTKTISTVSAKVPRPCIYGDKNKIMNAELWSEYPPEKWIKDILPKLKENLQIPLIISVGYTVEDMQILIPKLHKFADGFEISTHYVGKNLDIIGKTVRTIRENTDKPVFMKISPHIPEPAEFARVVKRNGANGIVAINSLGPTMIIDIPKREVLMGNRFGQVWTSGPVIKPTALAIVNTIREAVEDFTIIGTGGIATADDIIEFLLAGADAVQMLSSAMIYGKDLYEKLVKTLPSALKKYGFNSVEEVVKTRLKKGTEKFEAKYPKVDEDVCTACRLCEKICPYFAMKVGKAARADENKCFGCGLCESRCPVKAISGVIRG
jgi:dihydroorotate dehydrogenase subfamily 1